MSRGRAAAGSLLFLSDMYLPSAVLGAWLAREGVMQPADRLFVSGEIRANKNSGELFRIVRQQTGGDFAAWHHAGDHPVADVAKPRELGLAATHLAAGWLTARERLARGSEGEFAEVWRSLLAGAMRLARLERTPASPREELLGATAADVAGPLFYGFVRWTLSEARKRGLRRLSGTTPVLARELWLLVHPELKSLARIRAVIAWVEATLAAAGIK